MEINSAGNSNAPILLRAKLQIRRSTKKKKVQQNKKVPAGNQKSNLEKNTTQEVNQSLSNLQRGASRQRRGDPALLAKVGRKKIRCPVMP